MQAGYAKVDITPEPGIDLTGYLARMGPAEGVHDRLHCRALVLRDGDTQAALIETDTLGFGLQFTREVKRLLQRETGIPAGNIMLAATHTHSGPATVVLNHCGDVAIDYLGTLPGLALEAVRAAQADLGEAKVRVDRTTVTGVALNRRDRGNGPLDEELTVVSFVPPSGAAKAALLHYSCHAVVLGPDNLLYSADFPGAACAATEAATGVPCMFAQGPCGDINPVIHPGSFDDVESTGMRIANAAAALLRGGGAGRDVSLAVEERPLSLPLAALPSLDSLYQFRAEQRRDPGEVEAQFRPVQQKVAQAMSGWAELIIRSYASGCTCTELPVVVQRFQLGDFVLVAIPGEAFVEFGLEAKSLAAAGGKQAVVVAYANGDIGYVPTVAAYAKGGYEVEWAYRYYGYPAPVAPEAGEMIRGAISDFVNHR
ncbi:MAG: neutral/alkaline non-lysosomal ceramidase N-terminal domain-containing protein [Anaerolineae bacterium]